MRFYLKRWRLIVVALMAALAVSISSSNAFANEPGESNNWTTEQAGGRNVTSQDTLAEAYDAHGNHVDVWHGYEDNIVWVSYNNHAAFQIGTSATYVAPRVEYYAASDRFYIFHTGTNGNIYYSWAQAAVADYASSWSGWIQLVGNTTQQSVSVADSPSGMMIAYRGYGNDTRLFYVWYDRASGIFFPPVAMTGGRSNSAPVITYNPVLQRFYAVIRGLDDDRIYYSYQALGSNVWNTWTQLPSIQTDSSPVIAATSSGNMLVSTRDYDGNLWFQVIGRVTGFEGWRQESTHWRTDRAPFLSVVGSVVYILILGQIGGLVNWKPAYQG